MRIGEILREVKIETVNGVRVWRNPSFAGLVQLAAEGPLKGSVYGRDLFVWDAMQGWHDQMDEALGLPGGQGIYVMPEGRVAEATEWQDSPYVDGKGIRLYWQDYLEPPAILALQRLIKTMRPGGSVPPSTKRPH